MGAYISLAALIIQITFLGVVLSVVGIAVNRFIQKHLATRSQKKVSHADLARARAAARAR